MIGLLLLGISCEFELSSIKTDPSLLKKILDKGELTVITRNNAHCYYSYRDQEMGFEHDLAQAFAEIGRASCRERV